MRSLIMLNSTWYCNRYTSVFDTETCDQIIEDAYEHGKEDNARIQGSDGEFYELRLIEDINIYKSLDEKIKLANAECEWNFDYHTLEAIKFIELNVGHYSDWHLDSSFVNSELGEARKHTIIIMLSDAQEYLAPGNIEIIGGLPNQEADWNTEIQLDKGDMLILPACVAYKVNVVQDGQQKMLVTHTVGPSWR